MICEFIYIYILYSLIAEGFISEPLDNRSIVSQAFSRILRDPDSALFTLNEKINRISVTYYSLNRNTTYLPEMCHKISSLFLLCLP